LRRSTTVSGHHDFGANGGETYGMGEMSLAASDDTLNVPYKPIYNEAVLGELTQLVESRESFNQWYTDVPEYNLTIVGTLRFDPVLAQPGVFEFDDQLFFPTDGRGFGDPELENQDGNVPEEFWAICDGPEERHAFSFTSEVR
jgi:hypothetical protein